MIHRRRRISAAAVVSFTAICASVNVALPQSLPLPNAAGDGWGAATASVRAYYARTGDLSTVLRAATAPLVSTEGLIVFQPIRTAVSGEYKGRECDFYAKLKTTDFAENPYFAETAYQVAKATLPPGLISRDVISEIGSYIAYGAGTGEPAACVCESMPIKDVTEICDRLFRPPEGHDQSRFLAAGSR